MSCWGKEKKPTCCEGIPRALCELLDDAGDLGLFECARRREVEHLPALRGEDLSDADRHRGRANRRLPVRLVLCDTPAKPQTILAVFLGLRNRISARAKY